MVPLAECLVDESELSRATHSYAILDAGTRLLYRIKSNYIFQNAINSLRKRFAASETEKKARFSIVRDFHA
jgi:hypothetical protein